MNKEEINDKIHLNIKLYDYVSFKYNTDILNSYIYEIGIGENTYKIFNNKTKSEEYIQSCDIISIQNKITYKNKNINFYNEKNKQLIILFYVSTIIDENEIILQNK